MALTVRLQITKKFASHKRNGKSAIRYEVALGILAVSVVWVNGSFPAGAYPDIEIFRSCLSQWPDMGERVEADDGYTSDAPGKTKCSASVTNKLENETMQN